MIGRCVVIDMQKVSRKPLVKWLINRIMLYDKNRTFGRVLVSVSVFIDKTCVFFELLSVDEDNT